MDIPTHALTSFALARGAFPRCRWPIVVGMVFAGTIADIDLVSALFGPGTYFAARRTYTHSLVGTLAVAVVAILLARVLEKKQPEGSWGLILTMTVAASAHVVLDVLQSEGVELLWPLQESRVALDWLPTMDPWILTLLVAGILVPELLRLVSSEIGAKSKSPRGRNGAMAALLCIAVYVGGRALLHSESLEAMEPRSYRGESPRNVGAFPDSFSVFNWHGVVETRSYLCVVNVPVGLGRSFDAETADCLNKPEVSSELQVAQKTQVAREYLRAVPFPRAAVGKTTEGYEVVIRSTRDLVETELRHRVAAEVQVSPKFEVTSEELVWAQDVRLR